MGIPQFHNEGVDQNGTSTINVSFAGFTWSANDIIEIVIGTDGYVPSLTTANGFVLAQDPQGNSASATTNGGTGGTAECGIFVFWKRAVGSTTATDPAPVFAAPSNSGTCWCLQPNSFSGARTTGTPYHAITTSIVTTATTAVTSVAATSTLANCLFMPRVASSTDDQAFNSWTMTGSAGPSGTKPPDTGWHNGSGNACAFTGDEGGFAAAGGPHTATTTFSAATKQALVTLVMASVNEASAADDDTVRVSLPAPAQRPGGGRQSSDDEFVPAVDDDAVSVVALPVVVPVTRYGSPSDDDVTSAAGGIVADDNGTQVLLSPTAAVRPPPVASSDDEVPTASGGAAVDEDGAPLPAAPTVPRYPLLVAPSDDEAPTASGGSIADEDNALVVGVPIVIAPPPATTSDDELSLLAFLVEDDVPAPVPAVVISVPRPAWSPDDEFPGGLSPAGVDEDPAALSPRPVLLAPAPRSRIADDEIVAPPALAIGALAFREKANTTTPNTGTLTTLTVYPAWTPSTTYHIITDDRVTNAGNAYEVTVTSGTSASSGGPTTTPAPVTNGAITDGSAKWNFLAAGTGAVNTQASGSVLLVSTGQGNDATSGTTPTDNKGNTYSIVGTKSLFAGFPQSSASTYSAALPASGGTGHTISGTWGAGLDGGGDERTIAFVEVIGGTKIQDHSQGEFSPNGSNVVTSASVTATGTAVLVCFCWMNGTVQADGFLHTATPGSGFSKLWLASGLLEIANGAGQVQMCTIAKTVAVAGTYTATITTTGGEGAVMHLIAVQGADLPPVAGEDDDGPVPQLRIASWQPRAQATSDDELSPSADADTDNDVTRAAISWVMPVMRFAGQADDEVAGQAVVEDDGAAVMGMPAVFRVLVGATDIDDVPMIALEERGQVMAVPVVAAPVPAVAVSDDEILSVTLVAEDDGVVVGAPALRPVLGLGVSDDEIATTGGASMVEEDSGGAPVPGVVRPILVVPPSVDEVGAASGASGIDDEVTARSVVLPPVPVTSVVLSDDEVGTALAVEDDQAGTAGVVAVVGPQPSVADDDSFALVPLDEDQGAVATAPAPVSVVLWVASDDDLPLVALLDDGGQLIALTWSAPPVGQSAGDDEFPAAEEPVLVVDEDQLLMPLVWQVPAVWQAGAIADELPKAKKPKPAGGGGTGLLDGFIAKQVASALVGAKLTKSATLIKVTPGVRTLVSGGTNPTSVGYKAQGIEQNILSLQLAGTLINGANAAIRLFGATIEGGQVPVPGDRIVIGGRTYTIVAEGVSRDAAGVSYLAQCKG